LLTFSLVGLCALWHPVATWAEAPDSLQNAKSEQIDKTPDFHKLSNEELLKKTESSLWTSLQNLRAEMRGLSTSQLLFKQAQIESDAFPKPENRIEQVVRDSQEPLETAKAKAEHAKARHDMFQQQMQLIQTEKQRLESHIEQVEQARLAADSFVATLDQMELPLLEIRLRLEDTSLTPDKVPVLLQSEQLEMHQQQLAQQREWLEELAQSVPITLKQLGTRLKEAKQDALEAEIEHALAEKLYGEALKRQELLQAYKDQTPESLNAKLPDLQEELVGLKGSMQLTHRGFARRQTEVNRLQQNIEALSLPDKTEQIRSGETVRTDEVEERTELVNEVIEYYDQRIDQTQALHSALTALVKDGETHISNAIVLNAHVFNMQVLIGILERAIREGQIRADAIPEVMRTEQLSQVKAKTEAAGRETRAAVEQAKQQLLGLSDQIENVKAARQEAERYLKQLQHQAEAAKKARRWETEVKDLTAQQVVERFQETAQRLSANRQTVQNVLRTFKSAKDKAEKEHLHFESLTDPLLRSAQHEATPEKQNIIRKLYAFSELELPADLKAAESIEVTDNADKVQPAETEKYQNLLTNRVRIIEAREEQRNRLKAALNDFKSQIEAYKNVLGETDSLLKQQYFNAFELKKRIGRGQLADDGIPDGITASLNQKRLKETESDLAELIQESAEVQQQIDHLDQPRENLDKIRTSLEETITSVGKRLDVTRELEKLQADIKRTAADRSKVETASLKQNAARRLTADDIREEQIFGYVPSPQADEVTDLMKVYYQELIELESKQANLKRQTALNERLIELAESEKAAVMNLLPLLQHQEEQLKSAEERAWITVKAGLAPDKAADLLDEYESKTGKRLSTLPPVKPGEKEAAILAGADLLFDRHAAVVAAQKWTRLFGQRLSEDGLDREIGAFQDQLGAIEADAAAIQRAMHRLVGHPPEALNKLDEADAPKTDADRQLLLRGDIWALRADRLNIRQQAVVDILIRLAIIIIAALMLTVIVIIALNLMSRRYRDPAFSGNAQTLLALSFLKALGKFAIWVTAIILILSTLGFNVGAILAGLGIGGLAIAMAARETLSDMVGGIMIFIERPFVIGDTVQISGGATVKVVDMTWRTTRLVDAFDYHHTVPNSQVANATIQNFTRNKPAGDYFSIYVSPEHEPDKVIATVNEALADCDAIMQDQDKDTMLAGIKTIGYTTVMEYWPWWYTTDYHNRNSTRAAVWHSIWAHLNNAGIKLEINPFQDRNGESGPVDIIPSGE
jgi:small-conductance mechanosensitive channel